MAEGMLGGILGDEEEKPEVESPEALAGAEAFASAVAAKLAGNDPGVARKTEEFLSAQTDLLRVQKEHLKDEHEARLHFLRGQAREVDLRRFGLRLRVGFQIFLALLGTAMGLGLAVMVYDAFHSRDVVIEPFEIAPGLTAPAPNGKILASALLDRLTQLKDATRIAAQKRGLSSAWTNEISIEVPETGLSISQINQLLKSRFGHDLHITGDLVARESGSLAINVRGDGILPKTFSDKANQLDVLVNLAAEYVYGESEPGLFAKYLGDANRPDEAVAFAKAHLQKVAPEEQALLLNYWANSLYGRDANEAALPLYREAVRLKPDYWVGYSNLTLNLTNRGEAEEVMRVCAQMRMLAGGRPGKAPEEMYEFCDKAVYNLLPLREALIAEIAATGGTVTTQSGAEGLKVAEFDIRLHDVDAARLRLETAQWDEKSHSDTALAAFAKALMAEEFADYASAAKTWDIYAQAYADPVVSQLYTAFICWSASTYERVGEPAKAEAALNAVGNLKFVDCYRFRGEVLDLRGNWAGAQEWYAKAVTLAPSVPVGYYSWGLALAKHGDLNGAAAKLMDANQRGPHWADPLKAWGDVLAKQGKAREALAKYDEAAKYAPNWKESKEAREAVAKQRS